MKMNKMLIAMLIVLFITMASIEKGEALDMSWLLGSKKVMTKNDTNCFKQCNDQCMSLKGANPKSCNHKCKLTCSGTASAATNPDSLRKISPSLPPS